MSPKVEKQIILRIAIMNRCCNPLKLDHHFKNTGLVKVSKKIRDMYNHLNENELVCTSCRKTVYKLNSNPNPINQTGILRI